MNREISEHENLWKMSQKIVLTGKLCENRYWQDVADDFAHIFGLFAEYLNEGQNHSPFLDQVPDC